MATQALFAGLVYDERGSLLATTTVGSDAFYVLEDNDFQRHISAEDVDRQVLSVFIEQLQNNRELAVEQALTMIGQDDLFTKAALDASLRNIDAEQIIGQGLPVEARNMMGMLGFRITIDYHGQVVDLQQPYAPGAEE